MGLDGMEWDGGVRIGTGIEIGIGILLRLVEEHVVWEYK